MSSPTYPTPQGPNPSAPCPASQAVGRSDGPDTRRDTRHDTWRALRDALQHHCNPLHVFCKLLRAGMRPGPARELCRAYERCVYRHMFPR